MVKLFDFFGGRKYCLVIAEIAFAIYCIVTKTAVEASLLDFIKWITGLYFTANVGHGGVQLLVSKGQAVNPQATDLQAFITGLQSLANQLKTQAPAAPSAPAPTPPSS